MRHHLRHTVLLLVAALAAGCADTPRATPSSGTATPGEAAESSTITTEAHPSTDVEAVPILSILGEPLKNTLQPLPTAIPTGAEGAAAPSEAQIATPELDETFAVVGGRDILFEFRPEKFQNKWYRGFEVKLMRVETRIGPQRSDDEVIVANTDGSFVWTEKAAPPTGNGASPRFVRIKTKFHDQPGVYLAIFRVRPFVPKDGENEYGKRLEYVGVLVVQR